MSTSETFSIKLVFRWFDGFNWEGLKQRKLQAPIIPKVCLTLTVFFGCLIPVLLFHSRYYGSFSFEG